MNIVDIYDDIALILRKKFRKKGVKQEQLLILYDFFAEALAACYTLFHLKY